MQNELICFIKGPNGERIKIYLALILPSIARVEQKYP